MRPLLAVTALVIAPALAHAQSGVQSTGDRDAALVSKDVDPSAGRSSIAAGEFV